MEDSRYKNKMQVMHHNAAQQIALDCLSTQSPHGSPYHVHPYPSPVRLQHAFQPPPANSPKMFYPKGLRPQQYEQRAFGTPQPSPILGRALCLTSKDSPVPGRVSHLNERFNDALTLNADTDAMVAKIGSMFPTVTDTHIRILLKKYFNREAVVISALQVEKHPLVMPGPLTMSPSAARLAKSAVGIYSAMAMAKGMAAASTQEYYLPFTLTPESSPSLFRLPSGTSSNYYGTTLKTSDGQITRQHSPKMKLKYLKSIFPKADEMMILEFLTDNDNNVQKVSAELTKRGFEKKEMNLAKKDVPPPPPPMPIKTNEPPKTLEQKIQLKAKYQNLFPNVPEGVIGIALDSVEYSDTLTEQILSSVLVEDEHPRIRFYEAKEIRRVTVVEPRGPIYDPSPRAPSPPPPVRRPKPWMQPATPILKTNQGPEPRHRSNYNAQRRGPNAQYHHGPRDALLLADYMPWSGPDPEIRGATFVRPAGPAPRARGAPLARGPSGHARGPQGLARGSTYKNNKKTPKHPPS